VPVVSSALTRLAQAICIRPASCRRKMVSDLPYPQPAPPHPQNQTRTRMRTRVRRITSLPWSSVTTVRSRAEMEAAAVMPLEPGGMRMKIAQPFKAGSRALPGKSPGRDERAFCRPGRDWEDVSRAQPSAEALGYCQRPILRWTTASGGRNFGRVTGISSG